jgi:hypothetical protein
MRWLLVLVVAACSNVYEEEAHKRSGLECEEVDDCNGIVLVDCRSAVDGPTYYFDEDTVEIISVCGGACWLPHPDPDRPEICRACPPPAWTCGD